MSKITLVLLTFISLNASAQIVGKKQLVAEARKSGDKIVAECSKGWEDVCYELKVYVVDKNLNFIEELNRFNVDGEDKSKILIKDLHKKSKKQSWKRWKTDSVSHNNKFTPSEAFKIDYANPDIPYTVKTIFRGVEVGANVIGYALDLLIMLPISIVEGLWVTVSVPVQFTNHGKFKAALKNLELEGKHKSRKFNARNFELLKNILRA
ncbi:MAG: hypothetical protein JNM93_11760 [Bacteriovoracaceae bacterium]|nr:hypothetical protein [Bacteriovoracaceae bacterium]